MKSNNTEVSLNNIPQELKNFNQWVAWRSEPRENSKLAKIPINPHTGNMAKTNDASTWGNFDDAVKMYQQKKFDGVGFVFSDTDPLVGIDLDDCLSDGLLSPEAEKIIEACNSYTEISPSGEGVHVYIKGALPEGVRRNGNVEVYDNKRFFTVTGNRLNKTPESIADGREAIQFMFDGVLTQEKASEDDRIIEQALSSANGKKIRRLWDGDYHGYQSRSEGDLALCQLLAFYTRDRLQIDRLFRKSGLYRNKWDETHSSDGKTYGHITIEKALGTSTDISLVEGTKEEAPEFFCTDLGNAERLVHYFGDVIRYCHAWKSWFIWDGTRWQADDIEGINELAKKTVRFIYDEAKKIDDDNRRQALAKHAVSSEAGRRITTMVNLAKSDSRVSIRPDEFDKDHYLLNCLNGVLDLRTGILNPHRKEDYITKIVPVEYNEGASCPQWEAFLETILNGNDNLIGFLQRASGYALTGDISEQCLFIFFGSGANGKSTFLRTIGLITGDYAQQTATETLLVKQKGAIPNDIARLKGARFITASEAEAEQRLAESLIKQMTGQDIITARFLHQEWFDFEPTYKIFLGTNHKPVIRGTDYAIWRRIKLIPFEVTIPEDERDGSLLDKLTQELPGILNWGVQGCLNWQLYGLGIPPEVTKATAEYKSEMDVLSEFIQECCEVGKDYQILSKDLYLAYKEWCERNGEALQKRNVFGSYLAERGFVSQRFSKGNRGWSGLRLK